MVISLTASPQKMALVGISLLACASMGCGKGSVSNSTISSSGDFGTVHEPLPSSNSIEEQMKQIIALGRGVHNIQEDDNGHVVRCIVVGDASIIDHTAPIRDIAISASRQAAIWRAYAELVKWKQTEVSLSEDAKSPTQKAESMIKDAEGRISGLQLLHICVDEGSLRTSVALGWNEVSEKTQLSSTNVRVREIFKESTANGLKRETFDERFWVDDVLVIQEDATFSEKGAEEDAEMHYRQWDSTGRPVVDVVIKGTSDGKSSRRATTGEVWMGGEFRVPVNVSH